MGAEPAGVEAKSKEPAKTVGPRLSSAVGNEGPPQPQVNLSPAPSEHGGNLGDEKCPELVPGDYEPL